MTVAAPILSVEERDAVPAQLANLGPAELAYARRYLRRRRVRAGALLFLEGDPCAGLFLVERGAIRLFTAHAGKEQTLRVVRPGEVCNEFAACSEGANLTSAEALDDTVALTLASPHVAYLLNRSEAFSRVLLAAMAEQMRHFVALVGDLSFHHVTARVAKVLLQSVYPTPGVGAGTAHRPLTQQELADLVGTAREVVARSIRTLATAGAIGVVRGRIAILDRRLLEEAAGETCAATTPHALAGPTARRGIVPFPPVVPRPPAVHYPTPNTVPAAFTAMLRTTRAGRDQVTA